MIRQYAAIKTICSSRIWPNAVAVTILFTSLAVLLLAGNRISADSPTRLNRTLSYRIIQRHPHDPKAFTQGLLYFNGYLYESTGLYGQSSLRKVEISTGRVLQRKMLSRKFFAEGLAEWQGRLFQLTWREKTGFIYAIKDFASAGTFQYSTEGWGLTHDGHTLIMSDGSHYLYFLDVGNLKPIRRVAVRDHGMPVDRLNELEYIRGSVYANVWMTDRIARINPETGNVTAWLDLSGLYPADNRSPEADVMNGIAYDAARNRLFVTGKLWPYLYELQLLQNQSGALMPLLPHQP